MSVTSSIPRIKILNSPSSSSPSTSTRTANSCCSSSLKFSPTKATKLTIRCSQTEGPIRRPMAPPSPREKPSSTPPPSPPPSNKAAVASGESVISLEFQRQKARELQEYFKQKKLEEANQGPAFGFVAKNEISNGRWAMFGFAVGMLTEYATGSDFVDQVKILLSNFGILDLE